MWKREGEESAVPCSSFIAWLLCEQHAKRTPCFLFLPHTACDNPFYTLPRVSVLWGGGWSRGLCLLWFALSFCSSSCLFSAVSFPFFDGIKLFYSTPSFLELSPPLEHSGSISTKAPFFPGTSSKCFTCLISPLTDELPPRPASFHPFILRTHTHAHFYLFLLDSVSVPVHNPPLCTSTSLFCVFFGRPE